MCQNVQKSSRYVQEKVFHTDDKHVRTGNHYFSFAFFGQSESGIHDSLANIRESRVHESLLQTMPDVVAASAAAGVPLARGHSE